MLKSQRILCNIWNSSALVSLRAGYCTTGERSESDSCRTDEVKKLLDSASIRSELHADSEWATLPYPEGALPTRDQSQFSVRPKVDPRETSIILFPGQGTQFVGMGKEIVKFPVARDMYDVASEILGYDLLKLCLNGPKTELDRTVHCQPAVMVSSLAAVERLKEERPAAIENCVATAGFSVGELSALVFAGALQFERAVRLVKIRAEAMQLASDMTPSGMLTVIYGPDSQLGHACLRAREWCKERGIERPECAIANYLYPHCKVVAGHLEALKFIEANVAQFKLRRVKRLPVSGAFHTKLMGPAVPAFAQALRRAAVSDPLISVHSNVDGKVYRNAAHVERQLPKQICKPVRWEQTLHVLYERTEGQHFPRTFECGPGQSLKTILKMVNAKAWDSCFNIDT